MNFGSLIGHTIDGKYKIERQLGKGGMGTVYLATHLGTERPVAVKVIVPQFMERAEFVERFRREARAAGRLRHPNVVDVTDFGIAETKNGKVAYLVMEYLDGCTLGEILDEEKQLPLIWSLDILEQVCSAVHAAHGQGIIHRDLKPDNIWLEPNQRGGYTVKVLDFGIAKLEAQHGESSAEDIHISVLPTLPINFGETVPDTRQSPTVADGRNSTIVSEKGTAILTPESGTPAPTETDFSEKGTAILEPHEADLNDKTAIYPSKQTHLVSKEDGTRLVSGGPETDRSLKGVTTESELTRVGAVLGTPLYMSPEQCRGEKLTPRSDIYSLGIIAYQMLGGKTPFEGDFTSVMLAHRETEPPPLEVKKVPHSIRKVIYSALAKNEDERPPTALAFASKLRAYSEGIGSLLTRALVIYSERLPKFLLLTFLVSVPILLLTVSRVIYNFLRAVGIIESGYSSAGLSGIWGVSSFFVQIFTSAFLVGITTWIVAQILAVPLRPISLRTAYKKAKERWKPLLKTVTASTLLALLSWAVGAFVGGALSLIIALPLYFFVSKAAAIAVGALGTLLGFVALGVHVTAIVMLIAPAIMMEGIRGREAFRRSIQLVKRAYRTVVAAAILHYVVPGLLGFILAFSVSGIVKNFDPNDERPPEATAAAQGPDDDDLNIQLDGSGVSVTTGKDAVKKAQSEKKSMRKALADAIFEMLWAPFAVIITSFISVITALIYFKTRQAGGESMQDLLEQFEDAERPKSKWQQRVQDRLIQSGRITSKP